MKYPLGVKCLILALCILASWQSVAQHPTPRQVAWADSTTEAVKEDDLMDNRIRLSLMDTVYRIFDANRDTCKQIEVRVMQATFLDNIGMADSALAYLHLANGLYDSHCDSTVLFYLYGNYTSIFLSLEELNQVNFSRLMIFYGSTRK
jgi:hypothetical protein